MQPVILYVDDEEKSLKYFTKSFSRLFEIRTAGSAEEAWPILESEADRIGVVLSDHRMPGEDGISFLGRVRERHPAVVRLLVTAYSELDTAVQGVNVGEIFRYIEKPWDIGELQRILEESLRRFERNTAATSQAPQAEAEAETEAKPDPEARRAADSWLREQFEHLSFFAAGLTVRFHGAFEAAEAFQEAAREAARIPDTPAAAPSDAERDRSREAVSEMVDRIQALRPDLRDHRSVPLREWLDRAFSSHPPGLKPPAGPNEDPPRIPLIEPVAEAWADAILQITRALGGESSWTCDIHPRLTGAVEIRWTRVGRPLSLEEHQALFAPFTRPPLPAILLGPSVAMLHFIAHHFGGRFNIRPKPDPRLVWTLPLDAGDTETEFIPRRRWFQLFRGSTGESRN